MKEAKALCPYFQSECKGLDCLSFTRKYTQEALTECIHYDECYSKIQKNINTRIEEEYKNPFSIMHTNGSFARHASSSIKHYIESEMIRECSNCNDNLHGTCKLLEIHIIIALPQMIEKK